MRRVPILLTLAVFLLTAALTAPGAIAAEPHGRSSRQIEKAAPGPHQILADLLGRLANLFAPEKPDGSPAPQKIGCILDPSGRCLAGAPEESGCGLDPDGRCLAGAPWEIGCGIDPDGRCGG